MLCSLEAASDTLLRDHVRLLDAAYAARQCDASKYVYTPFSDCIQSSSRGESRWNPGAESVRPMSSRDTCVQRPRPTTAGTRIPNELLFDPCPINTFVNGISCVRGGTMCCSTTHQLFNNLTKQNPDPRM